jgi:peptide chain release factor subunit 1
VFRLREGRLEEVVDQSEEQPGQHGQGGWSQARYERHIEKLVQDHFKTVGSEIDRRLRRGAATMVVVGPTELRSEFESALSAEAREAIVGWATAEAHATPTELLDVALPLLERARAEAAAATVERWRAEAGRNGRATAGWTHTLEAASDGRVEVLLVQEGASHDGYRCPECGRGAAAPGACPLDGNALEHVDDGLDLALHRVLAFGGAVVSVNGNSLADQEGIGALLRY